MDLTQEQIKNISENLSKIPYNNEKMWDKMNNILDYFNLLNEVDTNNIEATYSVITKTNILRDDIETKKTITTKELLECSNQNIIWNQIAISNIMK